jgi:hypothetical protein
VCKPHSALFGATACERMVEIFFKSWHDHVHTYNQNVLQGYGLGDFADQTAPRSVRRSRGAQTPGIHQCTTLCVVGTGSNFLNRARNGRYCNVVCDASSSHVTHDHQAKHSVWHFKCLCYVGCLTAVRALKALSSTLFNSLGGNVCASHTKIRLKNVQVT